jgi:threonine/homoserine/homoserine lactone efflux protein
MSIFLTIAVLHLFAVASPGPDFILVSRQCLRYGRRIAIWTSLGIAIGILFHVALSLTGLSILLQNQPDLFWYIKLLASLYIGYLGIVSLVSKSSNKFVEDATGQVGNQLRSVTTGLLTNVLNPKALIFFITVFAVAINKETGIFVKSLLGIYMSVATFIWFTLVSILLTNKKAIERFKKAIPLLEKVTGFFLLLIAIQIIFQQTY